MGVVDGEHTVSAVDADLDVYKRQRRLERRGIPYTLTPGVPAFAAAAAALQCELTVPELAQSVVLTRVSGRASRMPEHEKFATFAASGATLVIHLAIHAIDAIANELTPFYGADCPAAVVVQASSPAQRILRGTLDVYKRQAHLARASSIRHRCRSTRSTRNLPLPTPPTSTWPGFIPAICRSTRRSPSNCAGSSGAASPIR